MARYTGPKTKICRIFGEPITGNGKWLTKNSNPPGMHGANRKRKTLGEYALQLREKQKAKYTYGLLERQFRNLFEKASVMKGVTGDNMLSMLESRLDNVVLRAGFATSRAQARQLVRHGHISVNGRRTNIPSFQAKPGDTLEVVEKSRKVTSIIASRDATAHYPSPNWLDVDRENFKARVTQAPKREDLVQIQLNEQLIVELYSK